MAPSEGVPDKRLRLPVGHLFIFVPDEMNSGPNRSLPGVLNPDKVFLPAGPQHDCPDKVFGLPEINVVLWD
jgi:hypothetical protein